MAVKLRLTRKGKTKQPFYRIVATESSVARDGKYIERIGHYDPVKNPPEILLDEEKALKWLSHGATPSETVKSIFRKKGLMLKWHLQKSGMPQDKIDEEFKRWELLQIEKTRKEEALKAQQDREEQEKKKKDKEKTEAAEKSDVAADAVESTPVEEQPVADAQPEAEAPAEEKTAEESAAAEETSDESLKEESAPEKAEDQAETPEEADEAKPAQAEAEEKKEKE